MQLAKELTEYTTNSSKINYNFTFPINNSLKVVGQLQVQIPLLELCFPIFIASSIVFGKGCPTVSGKNMHAKEAVIANVPIIIIGAGNQKGCRSCSRRANIPPSRATQLHTPTAVLRI